jgi:hypothetical protein
MKFWNTLSALLTAGGIAIVVSQGYLAISEPSGRSSNIIGVFAGAAVGFVGMGFLMREFGGSPRRFLSTVPRSEVAELRRKAVRHGLAATGLAVILVAFGCLATAGFITWTPAIAVMWICFFGDLAVIARLGYVKREAFSIGRKQRS